MAAALLARHAGERIDVRSAGTMPSETLHPTVIRSMAEIGVDVAEERPKALTTEAVEVADVVITMGCGDACPVFPGKRYLDWQLDDPSGLPLEAVGVIRDQIDGLVRELIDELLG